MNRLKIIAFKLCYKERENMQQIFSEDKDEEDPDDQDESDLDGDEEDPDD